MTEEMRVIRHGPDRPPMKMYQRVFTAPDHSSAYPWRASRVTNRKSFGSA